MCAAARHANTYTYQTLASILYMSTCCGYMVFICSGWAAADIAQVGADIFRGSQVPLRFVRALSSTSRESEFLCICVRLHDCRAPHHTVYRAILLMQPPCSKRRSGAALGVQRFIFGTPCAAKSLPNNTFGKNAVCGNSISSVLFIIDTRFMGAGRLFIRYIRRKLSQKLIYRIAAVWW